jgi:hypothetical protein
MPHSHDVDQLLAIIYFVDNSVFANANPVQASAPSDLAAA